jgi:hypothetical protein
MLKAVTDALSNCLQPTTCKHSTQPLTQMAVLHLAPYYFGFQKNTHPPVAGVLGQSSAMGAVQFSSRHQPPRRGQEV